MDYTKIVCWILDPLKDLIASAFEEYDRLHLSECHQPHNHTYRSALIPHSYVETTSINKQITTEPPTCNHPTCNHPCHTAKEYGTYPGEEPDSPHRSLPWEKWQFCARCGIKL